MKTCVECYCDIDPPEEDAVICVLCATLEKANRHIRNILGKGSRNSPHTEEPSRKLLPPHLTDTPPEM